MNITYEDFFDCYFNVVLNLSGLLPAGPSFICFKYLLNTIMSVSEMDLLRRNQDILSCLPDRAWRFALLKCDSGRLQIGTALLVQELLEDLKACLPMLYPRISKFAGPLYLMIPWILSWWPASGASSLVRSCVEI